MADNLDIGKMTDSEKTELMFHMISQLKEAVKSTTNGYMKTGAILSMIFDNKLYKNFSYDVETWEQFVSEVCPFKIATADNLRRIYKTYIEHIGDRVIPFTRLLEALPIVTKNNINTILDDAEVLPRKGWSDQIRSAKNKIPTDECSHSSVTMYSKCNLCGMWLKRS